MKILHVIDSLGTGGMERVVIDVVNGLDPKSFDHRVCCLSRRGEVADQLREGVDCIVLAKGARADYLLPFKIARLISDWRPDIVHSQSWSGIDAALACLLDGGPRLVHSEHGRNFPHIDSEPLKSRALRRGLYHFADTVFAVSNEVRDYYSRQTGFPAERMQVIANGIDTARIDRAGGENIRHELGIDPADFVVGTVARLDRTKDVMMLARSFAILRQSLESPEPKLLIAGEGPQKQEIADFAVSSGLRDSIILTGARNDVPRLLNSMNVFALTSLSEGMPLTILEAMCARLPVMATGVGSLPDLIDDGINGFMIPNRDVEAFARKLKHFALNPEFAGTCGEAGRRKVELNYSLGRMLDKYVKMYGATIKREKRGIRGNC